MAEALQLLHRSIFNQANTHIDLTKRTANIIDKYVRASPLAFDALGVDDAAAAAAAAAVAASDAVRGDDFGCSVDSSDIC